jgi:hypothetical protein
MACYQFSLDAPLRRRIEQRDAHTTYSPGVVASLFSFARTFTVATPSAIVVVAA